jgi:hypothetical protein
VVARTGAVIIVPINPATTSSPSVILSFMSLSQ